MPGAIRESLLRLSTLCSIAVARRHLSHKVDALGSHGHQLQGPRRPVAHGGIHQRGRHDSGHPPVQCMSSRLVLSLPSAENAVQCDLISYTDRVSRKLSEISGCQTHCGRRSIITGRHLPEVMCRRRCLWEAVELSHGGGMVGGRKSYPQIPLPCQPLQLLHHPPAFLWAQHGPALPPSTALHAAEQHRESPARNGRTFW